jgi:histidinol-phosphate aminotransferase
MTVDLCEQSPAYIRAIAPYQPGKPISELAREMGLDEKKIIKLASNENPRGVSPKAKKAIERELADLSRYPDGNAFELKAALARRYDVTQAQLVIGNGSNDLLELVAGAFLAPGKAAVYSQHAFAVYPLAVQARGAQGIVVPAKTFAHDLPAMLKAITPATRVVFIANPNNPTGTFAGGKDLEIFLQAVPPDVAVVLDEAYTEYIPPEKRYDSLLWVQKHPNLIVTRTFSKIYGLAGLRVGFGVMDPKIADLLNRVRQPFNVNSLALAASTAALEDDEFVAKSTDMNRAGMTKLQAEFKRLGIAYIPSVANFISFRVPRSENAKTRPVAGAVYEKLLRAGVIVRPLGGYEMPDHLRVTVGLPEENEKFLAALKKALGLE